MDLRRSATQANLTHNPQTEAGNFGALGERVFTVSGVWELSLFILYALRWQIEVFFRELKSDMGLEDDSGGDFRAYERFFCV